jgi:hypothetical protein
MTDQSRSAKRARFSAQTPEHTSRRRLLVAAGAALLAGASGGLAVVALGRVRRSHTAVAAGKGETAVLAAAPEAATHGHDPYPQVVAQDGQVRLPVSTFGDGQARHYTYMAGDRPIEFFVMQSGDGTLRAAFNACDVCYQARQGYLQDGDEMVCMNCGRRFPADMVNEVQGGCNPAPVARTVEGELLIIQAADLAGGARFF